MATLGRNDACPCGSGKKFALCCLNRAADSDGLTSPRSRRRQDALAAKLLRFAEEVYGAAAFAVAIDEFYCWPPEPMEPLREDFQLFFPWFYYLWLPDPNDTALNPGIPPGMPIAAALLARSDAGLSEDERGYLRAACKHSFSFYHVADCEPGEGMILRDLLTSEQYRVKERRASCCVGAGEILFAHLVPVQDFCRIDGLGAIPLATEQAAPIDALRHHLRQEYGQLSESELREWDLELRELYWALAQARLNNEEVAKLTADGNEPLQHRIEYAHCSLPAVFNAIRDLAGDAAERQLLQAAEFDEAGSLSRVNMPWLQRINPACVADGHVILGRLGLDATRLVAEVESLDRAATLVRLLDQRLADLATRQGAITRVLDADDVFRESGPSEQFSDAAVSVETAELALERQLETMRRNYWRAWLESEIPQLDGQTPQQAAQHPGGREQLESLLEILAHPPGGAAELAAPVVWLRETLGLAAEAKGTAEHPGFVDPDRQLDLTVPGQVLDEENFDDDLARLDDGLLDEYAQESSRLAQAAMLQTVENQLRSNEPKEVRETLVRLMAMGYSRGQACELIAAVLAAETFAVLQSQQPFQPPRYITHLKALPRMPWNVAAAPSRNGGRGSGR
jgi:hypothetical protein